MQGMCRVLTKDVKRNNTPKRKLKLQNILACVLSTAISATAHASPTCDQTLITIDFDFSHTATGCLVELIAFIQSDESTISDFLLMMEEKCKPSLWRENTHNPSANRTVSLCVTLRLLAVVSYLYLSRPFGISIASVHRCFHKTLRALDQTLTPICFPQTK